MATPPTAKLASNCFATWEKGTRFFKKADNVAGSLCLHDKFINQAIAAPQNQIGKAGGNYAQQNAFYHKRHTDEQDRAAPNKFHNVDFFSAVKYRNLNGIGNNNQRNRQQNNDDTGATDINSSFDSCRGLSATLVGALTRIIPGMDSI